MGGPVGDGGGRCEHCIGSKFTAQYRILCRVIVEEGAISVELEVQRCSTSNVLFTTFDIQSLRSRRCDLI